MARLSETEKKRLIADLETAQYSVRELAKKYNVSVATVQKHKNSMTMPESEHIVNAGIAYKTALAGIEEPEKVNAIVNAVEDKTRRANLVYGIAEKALAKMGTMLDQVDQPRDIRDIVEATDKASITLGVNQRHANAVQIENMNAQQQSQATNIEVIEDKAVND